MTSKSLILLTHTGLDEGQLNALYSAVYDVVWERYLGEVQVKKISSPIVDSNDIKRGAIYHKDSGKTFCKVWFCIILSDFNKSCRNYAFIFLLPNSENTFTL